jgi:hypothetical protein
MTSERVIEMTSETTIDFVGIPKSSFPNPKSERKRTDFEYVRFAGVACRPSCKAQKAVCLPTTLVSRFSRNSQNQPKTTVCEGEGRFPDLHSSHYTRM